MQARCSRSWGQQGHCSLRSQSVNIKHHTLAFGMLIQPSLESPPARPNRLQEPKGAQALHLHGVHDSGTGARLA